MAQEVRRVQKAAKNLSFRAPAPIAKAMRTQLKSYSANEMIFREGEVGECAYLIEKGRVLIFVNKGDQEVALKVLGEGEVFGEMSLIDNSPRSASCRALDGTHLIIVTKDQLIDRIQGADAVVRLLMRALLERLRSQNDSIRGKSLAPKSAPTGLDKETKEAVERIELENRIFEGLKNDEFCPFYQPIYDLQTSRIIGCEALLRWLSPQNGIISPAIFMDVVEESALVLQAGKVAIEKCLRDLPRLKQGAGNPETFYVSVNVSGRQFADPQFVENLEESRKRFNVSPGEIKLEVTERVMTEGPVALATLQKCRELGYLLAIDDFGTGFSSLQYLASMPLTDLKIDRSFVMKILEDDKSLSIVKSLIHMAGLLGLGLIAEGIETDPQLKLLRQLGVDSGQGWLFCKALPIDQFEQLSSTPSLKAA